MHRQTKQRLTNHDSLPRPHERVTHELKVKDKEASTPGLTLPKPHRHWKAKEPQGHKKYIRNSSSTSLPKTKENLSNLFIKYTPHDFCVWLVLCLFLISVKRTESSKDQEKIKPELTNNKTSHKEVQNNLQRDTRINENLGKLTANKNQDILKSTEFLSYHKKDSENAT